MWTWSKQQIPPYGITFSSIHFIRTVKKVKILLLYNSTSFDHRPWKKIWILERGSTGWPQFRCGIRKSSFLGHPQFCIETKVELSSEATMLIMDFLTLPRSHASLRTQLSFPAVRPSSLQPELFPWLSLKAHRCWSPCRLGGDIRIVGSQLIYHQQSYCLNICRVMLSRHLLCF